MKHELSLAIHMEKPLLTAWVGCYVGWGGAAGDLQGGANRISQADGASDMAHPCWGDSGGGRGVRKGMMASAHLSVWEEAIPQLSP